MRIRLILIILLCCLSYTRFAEWLNQNGAFLVRLHNLPHRGLGMLYTAHILRPDRPDYARDYLVNWYYVFVDQEISIEGQKQKPEVYMEAARLAREFHSTTDPQVKDIWMLQRQMMRNHFRAWAVDAGPSVSVLPDK